MKELSLFTGMGGGIYGSLILGWQTVAYVERDEYCQKVIKQRIANGWFDAGDIYGDIKDFNEQHAHKYTGQIDILTGGFPCQPFSVAGKRKGTSDERYLFDEIIKTIQIVQPRQALFENVPGLLDSPAIIEIYQSLNKAGYQLKTPLVLGSDDCGNIHRRKRVWLLANATSSRRSAGGNYRESRPIQENTERHMEESKQERGRGKLGLTENLGIPLPTPNAADGPKFYVVRPQAVNARFATIRQKHIIHDLVYNLPTPTANESKGSGKKRYKGAKTSEAVRNCLNDPIYLNPCFAEWMMNYPIGSSDLKPLATGKTPS